MLSILLMVMNLICAALKRLIVQLLKKRKYSHRIACFGISMQIWDTQFLRWFLQKMDGTTALKFVRSRHSPEDGGDFNRARRQQIFLEAVRDRVLSIGFIPKISSSEWSWGKCSYRYISRAYEETSQRSTFCKEYSTRQIVLTTDNYLSHDISDDGQYILISKPGQTIGLCCKRLRALFEGHYTNTLPWLVHQNTY